MVAIIDRFRCAIRELRRRSTESPVCQQHSIWEKVPISVFVNILGQCSLSDIYALSLTCRTLYQQIYRNEYFISQEYLNRRRHRRQLTGGHRGTAIVSPGDDLTFISELFPPPPPLYTDGSMQSDLPEYSFEYLADLTRCWKTCVRLSYHLASYVVQHHLETDSIAQSLWSSSKTEKDVAYSKGVSLLQSTILYPIAYLVFFLETYAASDPETPGMNGVHWQHSLKIQQSILQHPPFTDTQVLISTHHCMLLLCSAVRRLMTPAIPYSSTESWVSLLLTTSTLERIEEFFVAAADDGLSSTWTRRRKFMRNMRNDLDEYLASGSGVSGDGAPVNPGLRDIWFEAAEREMACRAALPHAGEEPVPILYGSSVLLRCRFCDD